MDGMKPFRPAGDTFMVLGSTPATGYVTRAGGPAAGEVTYRIHNPGTVDAWVGYGMTSAAALANAVIPAVGSPQPSLPIPNGTVKVFTLSPLLFFCAVVASGKAELTVTPGDGFD